MLERIQYALFVLLFVLAGISIEASPESITAAVK